MTHGDVGNDIHSDNGSTIGATVFGEKCSRGRESGCVFKEIGVWLEQSREEDKGSR